MAVFSAPSSSSASSPSPSSSSSSSSSAGAASSSDPSSGSSSSSSSTTLGAPSVGAGAVFRFLAAGGAVLRHCDQPLHSSFAIGSDSYLQELLHHRLLPRMKLLLLQHRRHRMPRIYSVYVRKLFGAKRTAQPMGCYCMTNYKGTQSKTQLY